MSIRCPRRTAAALAQRPPVEIAHQRKAARQHAAMGQRRQQLSAAFDRALRCLIESARRALPAVGERDHTLALAADAVAMRLGVRPQSRRQRATSRP